MVWFPWNSILSERAEQIVFGVDDRSSASDGRIDGMERRSNGAVRHATRIFTRLPRLVCVHRSQVLEQCSPAFIPKCGSTGATVPTSV